jgi:hypothetical protein
MVFPSISETPVRAHDLEPKGLHVGAGMRLGKASIVDRYTSEPLQVIVNGDPRNVESLIAQWDLAHEQAARKKQGT